MGEREKGGREKKKVKKDAGKPTLSASFAPPPPPVEVLKTKGKKLKGE